MRTFIVLTLSFLIAVSVCNAQNKDSKKAETPRLDSLKSSVYLAFERFEILEPRYEGESKEHVWIRFHNNTKWNVYSSVNGCRPEQDKCISFYEVHRQPRYFGTEKEKQFFSGYWADVSSERTTEPGKSFSFAIPKNNLTEGFYITVKFRYEWEFVDGRTRHQTLFFWSDLPEETKK